MQTSGSIPQHQHVKSLKPAQCPRCKEQKVEFVIHIEGGAHCVDCHATITERVPCDLPAHPDASRYWSAVSLSLRLDPPKIQTKKRHAGVSSISIEAQEQARRAAKKAER